MVTDGVGRAVLLSCFVLFGDAIRAIGDDNGGDMCIEFSLQTPCLELLGPLTSPVLSQSLWVVVYFFSVGLRMLFF